MTRLRVAVIMVALVLVPVATFAVAKSVPTSSASPEATGQITYRYQAVLTRFERTHAGYSCSFDQPNNPNATTASCSEGTGGANSNQVTFTVMRIGADSRQAPP